MPSLHREAEKKYAADDGFELPSLVELALPADDGPGAVDPGTPLAESEPVRQQLEAVYFDTADLHLAAAGLTLRRRKGGDDAGWHLKVPAGGGVRTEVRVPLGRGSRTVPKPLQAMVRAHSGGAALVPVAEIATDRTVRRLVDATGQVLAELADDRVTARRLVPAADGTRVAGAAETWREIEVELVEGADELLGAVDSRLLERGLTPAPSASKLAHVLAGAQASRAGEKAPTAEKLSKKAPAGAVVLAHIRAQVDQIRAHDLPVRLDAPDAVHKMRVATRRLRSALTTFKPLFEAEVVRPLRGELKWLAAELGAARDAEVMRDRVAAAVGIEDGLDAAASGHAVAQLDSAYREAHDRVLAELDGDRYHQILENLDRLVADPPFTERAADRAGRALPGMVGRSFTVVRGLVEQADARPAGAEREELLHDARKSAKAARYAGESVAPVFGTDATAFAEAMEAVQEALGEHQDSVLTRQRLRELATSTDSTEAAFLFGRLHALEEARAERVEHRFDEAWKAARRKSLRRWTR